MFQIELHVFHNCRLVLGAGNNSGAGANSAGGRVNNNEGGADSAEPAPGNIGGRADGSWGGVNNNRMGQTDRQTALRVR